MAIRLACLAAAVFAAGCDELRVQLPTPLTPAARGVNHSSFDPMATGVVTGTVTWSGPRPIVPPLRVCRITQAGMRWFDVPNPNTPGITRSGELANAVVHLRGVDGAKSAPWPHPRVTVEADDERIAVLPFGRTGFVPVGSEVEFRSASDSLLGVRARGDAYFTLMLPERASARRRRLDRPGRVELTSPAYLYWQTADLFVCEHPYYTLTDARGQFGFDNVPPGDYEIVCRLPGWTVASSERDPESGAVFRTSYSPAAEVTSKVRVVTGSTSDVRIDVAGSSFPSR